MQIYVYLNHCFWQGKGITVTLDLSGTRSAMAPFRAKLNDELTDRLNNSMEQSPSWEASGLSASQEIPSFAWNSEFHSRLRSYPSEPCERCHSHPYLYL